MDFYDVHNEKWLAEMLCNCISTKKDKMTLKMTLVSYQNDNFLQDSICG